MRATKRALFCAAALAALVSGVGCVNQKRELPPEPTPEPIRIRETLLADTIGAEALYASATPVLLRGFGLVVGLGESGSRDCPTAVREYLVDHFAREISHAADLKRRQRFSPQQLIDSLDTAVVEVYGVVPVGAVEGAPFDLQVRAIGTQTRSLEGGILLPADLRIFQPDATGEGMMAGRTLARGGGPVFTNPFRDEREARGDVLEALVLGGGRTVETREVRLLLNQPSYSQARQFERRINERFGQSPPAASAVSRGYVSLTTPLAYAEEPGRFLELVTHLPIQGAPLAVERKLEELAGGVSADAEVMDRIALVWEALGRVSVASIQPLYTHPEGAVRFHAARAGVRLRDVVALPAMTQIAEDADSPFRLAAIQELGRCDLPGALQPLERLIDDPDAQVRIAAYEGARRYPNLRIQTRTFAHVLNPRVVSMQLDVVDTSGPPLIYVSRTGAPRVAVFGTLMPVQMPLFYAHESERIILNANDDRGEIDLLWQTRGGRAVAEPIRITPRVVELVRALAEIPFADLDGAVHGIGSSYATVIDVLSDLSQAGKITAAVVLEQPAVAGRFGSELPPDRPATIEDGGLRGDRPEAEPAGLFPAEEPWPEEDPE